MKAFSFFFWLTRFLGRFSGLSGCLCLLLALVLRLVLAAPNWLRPAVPVVDVFCPKTSETPTARSGHRWRLAWLIQRREAAPRRRPGRRPTESAEVGAEQICHTNETLPCLWDVIRPDC